LGLIRFRGELALQLMRSPCRHTWWICTMCFMSLSWANT